MPSPLVAFSPYWYTADEILIIILLPVLEITHAPLPSAEVSSRLASASQQVIQLSVKITF